MLKRLLGKSGRRGSVAVEFALISSFFLLPLFGGSIDMVEYISAKQQANTALQALYYYALTYSSSASNTSGTEASSPETLITSGNTSATIALMNNSLHPLQSSSPTFTYKCINASGTVGSTYTTYASYSNTTSGYPASCSGSYPYTQIFVSFTVTTKVYFSIPVPFVSSYPLTITDTGTIQIL